MVHRLPLWFDRFDVLTTLSQSKGGAGPLRIPGVGGEIGKKFEG